VEGLRLVHVAADDTMSAIQALREQPDVVYAEPDYIMHAYATPNDPCFPLNILSVCQSTSLYGITKIGSPTAWNTTTGSSRGVVGVNWNVRLMALKYLSADTVAGTSTAIRAFSYAKQMKDFWVSSGGTKGANVRVLNNSWGPDRQFGSGYSQSLVDAIDSLNQ